MPFDQLLTLWIVDKTYFMSYKQLMQRESSNFSLYTATEFSRYRVTMTARGQPSLSVCSKCFWIIVRERFDEHGDVISACSFFAPTRHLSGQC